jgi:ribonuclease P protein component
MLPFEMRIHSSEQFALTTKKGKRYSTRSLVCYLLENHNQSQFGLIINKSVGGSVRRHRIARQLRHLTASQWASFPKGTNIVFRVLKPVDRYDSEFEEILAKINQEQKAKLGATQ